MSHGLSDSFGYPVLGHCHVHGSISDHLEFQAFLDKYPENPVTGIKFPSNLDIHGEF